MKKHILLSNIILILLVGSLFFVITHGQIQKIIMERHEEQMIHEMTLVKELLKSQYDGEVKKDLVEQMSDSIDVRITLMASDGIVLMDTEQNPELMDNHSQRPEIQEVLKTQKYATDVRFSETVKETHLYAATLMEIDDQVYFLRLSRPVTELKKVDQTFRLFMFFTLLLCGLFALLMGWMMTKKIILPIEKIASMSESISRGDYGFKIEGTYSEELTALIRSFNHMSFSLKEAMDNLNDRNAELTSILNSMTNGVIAIDVHRNIVLMNEKSYELLELSRDYVTSQESMYKVVRNKSIAKKINDSMSLCESYTEEVRYGEKEKLLSVHVHPFFDAQEEVRGSIVIIEDVTLMRKLEVMRRDFVSNVSHELKTPLTSIKGFVETLKHGAIEDQKTAKRFLDIIDLETERLYRLIQDILSLSEIEAMLPEEQKYWVEVKPVLNEVELLLGQKAKDKNIEIHVDLPSDLGLWAHRDRIKQLLLNLVDNAIKYTEEGCVEIRGCVKNQRVYIEVKDTGIGLTETHCERIFERFYRADKGRSRNQGGTGLGLSIVKHIVLLYGGQIKVKSQENVGTTFTMIFPMQ